MRTKRWIALAVVAALCVLFGDGPANAGGRLTFRVFGGQTLAGGAELQVHWAGSCPTGAAYPIRIQFAQAMDAVPGASEIAIASATGSLTCDGTTQTGVLTARVAAGGSPFVAGPVSYSAVLKGASPIKRQGSVSLTPGEVPPAGQSPVTVSGVKLRAWGAAVAVGATVTCPSGSGATVSAEALQAVGDRVAGGESHGQAVACTGSAQAVTLWVMAAPEGGAFAAGPVLLDVLTSIGSGTGWVEELVSY